MPFLCLPPSSGVQTGHLDQYRRNIGLLRNKNYFPLIGVAEHSIVTLTCHHPCLFCLDSGLDLVCDRLDVFRLSSSSGRNLQHRRTKEYRRVLDPSSKLSGRDRDDSEYFQVCLSSFSCFVCRLGGMTKSENVLQNVLKKC